jgi:polar amino acid transport system substrate-binding protein
MMFPALKTGWLGGKAGVLALFALLLLEPTAIARAENSAIVFDSTNTPPFWCPTLPENGLGGAILNLVSEAAGVQYSINYVPVKRFIHSEAAYIVGDPDILINQKHRAVFPIGIFRSAFFYYKPRHAVLEFNRLLNLQGYTLGVLRGTLEDKEYFVGKGINVEESDSVESLLKKLKQGRIDVCILVNATGQFFINQLFPDEKNNFAEVVIAGSARPIAIMIDVDAPEGRAVARRYRQVLDSVLHSPQYHGILERFYGKNAFPDDWFEQLHQFDQSYFIDLNN